MSQKPLFKKYIFLNHCINFNCILDNYLKSPSQDEQSGRLAVISQEEENQSHVHTSSFVVQARGDTVYPRRPLQSMVYLLGDGK